MAGIDPSTMRIYPSEDKSSWYKQPNKEERNRFFDGQREGFDMENPYSVNAQGIVRPNYAYSGAMMKANWHPFPNTNYVTDKDGVVIGYSQPDTVANKMTYDDLYTMYAQQRYLMEKYGDMLE